MVRKDIYLGTKHSKKNAVMTEKKFTILKKGKLQLKKNLGQRKLSNFCKKISNLVRKYLDSIQQ